MPQKVNRGVVSCGDDVAESASDLREYCNGDYERLWKVPYSGGPLGVNHLCEPVPAPMAELEKIAQMCVLAQRCFSCLIQR